MTDREATKMMFERYQTMLEDQTFAGPEMTDAKHLRWMCETVDCDWPIDKISRWLGFVQGCVIMNDLTSVMIERDFSRQFFKPISK